MISRLRHVVITSSTRNMSITSSLRHKYYSEIEKVWKLRDPLPLRFLKDVVFRRAKKDEDLKMKDQDEDQDEDQDHKKKQK